MSDHGGRDWCLDDDRGGVEGVNPAIPEPARVARWCVAQGFPVFPLSPGCKTPLPGCPRCRRGSSAYVEHSAEECTCPAEDGWCHGFYAATLSPARVERWWSQPRRGVGVATGPARLVVVDVDRHGKTPPADPRRILPGLEVSLAEAVTVRDGLDVLRLLASRCERGDPALGTSTLTVRTPSGGLHLWFRAPARTTWRSSVGGDHRGRSLGWQLDVRAQGGYIVAPGTRTKTGSYEVIGPMTAPALLPDWLAGQLTRSGHLIEEPYAALDHPAVPNRARAAARVARVESRSWAEKTVATALGQIAACGQLAEGAGWSATVNKAAYTLGGLVAAGHITEGAALEALRGAAISARPSKENVAWGIISSGFAAGKRRALHPKDDR
ncbi:bifunctional DNA primase/polymerase [Streptomyces mirabilis]|uniref:bifunctional DNA primase/polymerase n=1 Tax=Streptomyces mirabilis TaxID=68239 RepID=UPI0033F94852